MHQGHRTRGHRPGFRACLAVLCLLVTTSAHAGWLARVFGSHHDTKAEQSAPAATAASAEQAGAAPADAAPSPAAVPATSAASTKATTASQPAVAVPDVPGNDGDDQEDPAAATDTATDATDSGDGKDDSVVLPNVEESSLGEDDDLLKNISTQDLSTKGDLWSRVRQGFKLDSSIDNERIDIQRNWYLQHQDYLDRMALRATRYLYYTVAEAEKRGLPTELALLPVIESAYDPFAYSHASAAGMWQFIPGTAKIMGVRQNWWFDGRRDVIDSTRAAYDFLSLLYEKFGDWQLVLAAYNAGPGTVQRAIERNQARGLPTDFWSLRLPAETMSYVPRFLAVVQLIKSPETYGISLRPVVNQPFFRIVNTNGQVDLTSAAQIAGVSLKEFYQLNPGFNRWATDPDGPHRILVPASLPQDFESQLEALPTPELTETESYKVKRGDTLYAVARRFGVLPAEVKRLNHLKSDRLPVGRKLTITHAHISPAFLALSKEMRLDELADAAVVGTIARRYTVRRGDTLGRIAHRHHVSLKSLARWNGLTTHSRVHPGQHLTLRMRPAPARRVARNSHSRSSMKRIHYQVRRGDTLSSIGRRYNISVTQIRRWNGSRTLHPGQGLVLFIADNTRGRDL